jgi:hypothetical protein
VLTKYVFKFDSKFYTHFLYCHISTLRKYLDLRTKELYRIIGKHSPLSLSNKLLLYKAILKPAWTYGIELWGCASP